MPHKLRLVFEVELDQDLNQEEADRIANNLAFLPDLARNEGLITREEEDITLKDSSWQVEVHVDGKWLTLEEWADLEEDALADLARRIERV